VYARRAVPNIDHRRKRICGSNIARYFARTNPVVLAVHESALANDLCPTAPQVQMDVRDARSVQRALEQVAPAIVIHAAGNKDVRYCEANPEEAVAINATGAGYVARACRDAGARMVYLSTDLVFDCTKGGYEENRRTAAPAGVWQIEIAG